MTFVRNRPRRALSVLALFGLCIISLSPFLHQAIVRAQIDNNEPNRPYASVVPCIRPGADTGRAFHDAPRLITTCYGSRWNNGGYTTNPVNVDQGDSLPTEPAVVAFGDGKPDTGGAEPGHIAVSNLGQVGSVYGVAYSSGIHPSAPAGDPKHGRVFVGAFYKRLTRYGAGGPGGIYQIDYTTGTVKLWATVPNVVPGPNGATHNAGDGSQARFPNDPAGNNPYSPEMGGTHRVGADQADKNWATKVSLGDIDIDADERYLYAVNLRNNRIYRFDTWSSNPQSTMTVLPASPLYNNPNACNTSGRSGPQDLHFFALKVTSFGVYAGFTCSAESSGDRRDLAAGVQRYNFSTGTWAAPIWTNSYDGFGLTAYDAQRGTWNGYDMAWHVWNQFDPGSTQVAPQPILSNIDFDEQRNMILGFRDRLGDMTSSGRYVPGEQQGVAGGDTLIAEFNETTSRWELPSTGADRFDDHTDFVHEEATWGGVTYIPGTHGGVYGGELATTVVHPYRNNGAGAAWFDLGGGRPTAREELYFSASGTQSYSKAAGLGDLEIECVWRAVGNRVWRDSNGNGIQDGGEATINGVRLQLTDMSDNVLATVTTGPIENSDDNWRFYINPFYPYKVKIDPAMFNPGQPLAGLHVSMHDQGGNDGTDNDMTMWNNTLVVPGGPNKEVNLTYDIGLTDQPRIGDRVWRDANGNGVFEGGEPGIDGVTIELLDSSGAVIQTSTTEAGGFYGFTVSPNTAYSVRIASGSFAAGQPLSGLILSPRDRGGNDETDSDAHQITRTIAIPGQPGGAMNFTFDFGVMGSTQANGDVGDFVWNDNGNGVQNSGEPGIPGVTVRLINTADGSVTATTTTGASGQYRFQNVVPGTYVVEFAPPQSATAPPRDAGGDDARDSDTDSSTSWRTPAFQVIHDTAILTLDQGFMLPADVAVTKTGPARAAVGSDVSYTLAYTNAGPGTAQAVTVADTLPAGLTFVSAQPTPSTQSGQVVSWNVGDLAPSASGSITVVARVAGDAPAQVINPATITTTSTDTNTDNNTSSATTTITRPNVGIQKTGPATANVGTRVTYTLAYGNTGDGDAAAASVTDTLPAGLTFVSAQPAPSNVNGQVLTWNLNNIPAGATGRITVVTQLATSATNGTTITNTAAITTSTPNDTPSDNSGSSTTTVTTGTAIQLAYFRTERQSSGDVLIRWGTLSEQDTKEFKILRGTSNDRSKATLVETVTSKGSHGSDYSLTDADAPASGMLYYWLVEVETGGAETPYGPATVGKHFIYLPMTRR